MVRICLVLVWLIKFKIVVKVVVLLELVCFVIRISFWGCFVIFCIMLGSFNCLKLGILEERVCK